MKNEFIFYLRMSQLCKSVQYAYQSKTTSGLTCTDSVQFQNNIPEISHCGSRSPKYIKLGQFTLLFKPFVWCPSRRRRRPGLLKLPTVYTTPEKVESTALILQLSPGQTIATYQRNISQHCWAQHVVFVWPPCLMCCDMLGVVGSSLKMVKFGPTTPNTSQHIATGWPNARNMLRYVELACCDRLAGALVLPSTIIRHNENGAFRKRSLNRKNLKTPAARFSVDGRQFKSGALRKR